MRFFWNNDGKSEKGWFETLFLDYHALRLRYFDVKNQLLISKHVSRACLIIDGAIEQERSKIENNKFMKIRFLSSTDLVILRNDYFKTQNFIEPFFYTLHS